MPPTSRKEAEEKGTPTFIVKVQRSLFSVEAERMLVYNQDRDIMYEGPMAPEVREFLGKERKMFAWAVMNADGKVGLLEPAPWQDW